jgi:hypothetical protein
MWEARLFRPTPKSRAIPLHTNKMQRVIAKSKPPNPIETLSSQSTTELGIER